MEGAAITGELPAHLRRASEAVTVHFQAQWELVARVTEPIAAITEFMSGAAEIGERLAETGRRVHAVLDAHPEVFADFEDLPEDELELLFEVAADGRRRAALRLIPLTMHRDRAVRRAARRLIAELSKALPNWGQIVRRAKVLRRRVEESRQGPQPNTERQRSSVPAIVAVASSAARRVVNLTAPGAPQLVPSWGELAA